MGIFICLIVAMLAMNGISAWIGYSYAADKLEVERDANRRLRSQNHELSMRLKVSEHKAWRLENHLSEYEFETSKSGSLKDDVRKINIRCNEYSQEAIGQLVRDFQPYIGAYKE